MASPPTVRFGPFGFNPTTGSLWRGAEFLPLLPKDAAVLGVLVQHAGRIVTEDALLDAVWPQTYVTHTVIKNGIGRLRRALGDDPRAPRCIQTFLRCGYRFVWTVETQELGSVPEFRPSPGAVGQAAPPSPAAPALMVGRERELGLLQERFARALQGQHQVVFFSGEAGIGKTTVIDAFVAGVAAEEDLWLAHGQCIEHHGEGEPYGPVLEALDCPCRGAARAPLARSAAPGGAAVVGAAAGGAPRCRRLVYLRSFYTDLNGLFRKGLETPHLQSWRWPEHFYRRLIAKVDVGGGDVTSPDPCAVALCLGRRFFVGLPLIRPLFP